MFRDSLTSRLCKHCAAAPVLGFGKVGHRAAEGHREPQKATESRRGAQTATEIRRRPQRSAEGHREPQSTRQGQMRLVIAGNLRGPFWGWALETLEMFGGCLKLSFAVGCEFACLGTWVLEIPFLFMKADCPGARNSGAGLGGFETLETLENARNFLLAPEVFARREPQVHFQFCMFEKCSDFRVSGANEAKWAKVPFDLGVRLP